MKNILAMNISPIIPAKDAQERAKILVKDLASLTPEKVVSAALAMTRASSFNATTLNAEVPKFAVGALLKELGATYDKATGQITLSIKYDSIPDSMTYTNNGNKAKGIDPHVWLPTDEFKAKIGGSANGPANPFA